MADPTLSSGASVQMIGYESSLHTTLRVQPSLRGKSIQTLQHSWRVVEALNAIKARQPTPLRQQIFAEIVRSSDGTRA